MRRTGLSTGLLAARFVAFIRRHRLFAPGARVIAAVSGGVDSMCLLHLLLAVRERLVLEVEVAHFNHRLRGRHSTRDAAFVREAAARSGLAFHLGVARPFTAAERRGRSLQELARAARLGFLLGLARTRRAVVALGHQADDQAETLLMRFLAGAGPAALGGIPPASHGGALVHPLLGIRRAEIEAWLTARTLAHRTDHTNRSTRYLRNRVRLRLLPALTREYNPRLVERLGSLATILRRDQEFLEEQAREMLGRAAVSRRAIFFPAALLDVTHPALLSRAVLAGLRRLAAGGRGAIHDRDSSGADFSSRHLEALLAGVTGSRRWNLPGGILARRDAAGLELTLENRRQSPPLGELPLPLVGTVELRGAAGSITASVARRPPSFDPRAIGADRHRAVFDRDKILPPLVVRARRPGDRFRPLGGAGEKKLKAFLIDCKVPVAERERIPLVCDRSGIVWVAGIRPSEQCRVDAGTRRLLRLTFVRTSKKDRGADDPGGIVRPSRGGFSTARGSS